MVSSSSAPSSAAGIVDSTRNQASRSSAVLTERARTLANHAAISAHRSRRR
jgi:hypothetical protein